MARVQRKTSSLKLYHITKRGINDQIIFIDDSDREFFLECLSSLVSQRFKIHCYCLMNNHFHLILQVDALETLAKSIKILLCKYVERFNRRHHRKGSPFEGRFWSEAINNWNYFHACLKYILRNPLEAGIADINNYQWSSYRCYYSETNSFIEKRLVCKLYPDRYSLDTHLNNDSDIYINMRSEGYSQYKKGAKEIGAADKKKIQNYLKRKYNLYDPQDLSAKRKCELIAEIHRAMPHIPQARFIVFFQINRRTIASYFRKQTNVDKNYW